MRIRENKIKKIISALPRKVLWLILILMIIYNVINTVYGVFNKKLDLRIGKATMYTTEDKTMIPTIKTNDLIITKKCQPDDLNLQDIIIFDEIENTETTETVKNENEQILDILKALSNKLETITSILNKINIFK